MTIFTLLRHAPTEWNEQHRMQGRTDIPLSPRGEALARSWALPEQLRSATWFSSPLFRARQTAEILGFRTTVDDRLVEMNWGDWEGSTLEELRDLDSEAMRRNEAQGLDFKPPDGESPRMVQQRLKPWLAELVAHPNPVAAVTHKGVIRAVTAMATKWDMTGKEPHKIRQSTCRRFKISSDGELEFLSDLSLLEA